MIIELKKFGAILTSRQLGKESLLAFLPSLNNIPAEEKIYLDFSELSAFSPSWGDEFLTPLYKKFGQNLILKKTNNLSVEETIKTLEGANKIKFVWE